MKKRRMFAMLLAVCMIVGLAGCGTQSENPTESTNAVESTEDSSSAIDHTVKGKIQAYDGKTITIVAEDGENIVSDVSPDVTLTKEPPEGNGGGMGEAPAGDPPPKPEGEEEDDSYKITAEGTIVTLGYDENDVVIVIEMAYTQDMGEVLASEIITNDGKLSKKTYTTNGDMENALSVQGAKVSLDNVNVKKTGGASNDETEGDTFGYNAAFLAFERANVTITNSDIESNAVNGNGIFAFGSGTQVTVSDTSIHTTGSYSGGIMITNNGRLTANNLDVLTEGNHSAPIRSDHGGGIEVVNGGTYRSYGIDSPVIYATNSVDVSNIEGSADGSEAIVVVGAANVSVKNSTIKSDKNATTGHSVTENVQGMMVYNSGRNSDAHSKLTITDCDIEINTGDTFYVTNIFTDIDLQNTKLVNNDKSAYFIKVAGNSGKLGWGTPDSNGGHATFNVTDCDVAGNIVVDSISSLNLNLKNSTWSGRMEMSKNTNGSGNNKVNVTIDEGSTWVLTGNSYVTSLDNKGTIEFNGYSITLPDGSILTE